MNDQNREPVSRLIELSDEQSSAAAGELLGLRFADEPWSASLVQVLPDPTQRDEVLITISTGDVLAFAEVGGAYLVDAFLPQDVVRAQGRYRQLPAGVVLCCPNTRLSFAQMGEIWEASLQKASTLLDPAAAEQLRSRARDLSAIEDAQWLEKACPDGYHFINSVAINPYYAGVGVLSALFEPLFAASQKEGVALCLETYGERPRQIYQHKGFQVVEKIAVPNLALTQYRMLRPPSSTLQPAPLAQSAQRALQSTPITVQKAAPAPQLASLNQPNPTLQPVQPSPKAAPHPTPQVNIISDSVGDSAATIAVAAASQFTKDNCVIKRLPNAANLGQIEAFVDTLLEASDGEGIVVFYTIADPSLREQMEQFVGACNAQNRHVAAVDLLGPAIAAIAEATGMHPLGEAGLIRRTDPAYYNRVGAMEFAVDHDDGRNPEDLPQADIVLIGASRTSKTPLSIYLAMQGLRVANVPLALGTEPPKQLFELERSRVFGLTSQAELLSEIRTRRLGNALDVAGEYASQSYVQDDLDEARALMRRLGVIVVRTDNRAIEETAQEILRYYRQAHPSRLGGR